MTEIRKYRIVRTKGELTMKKIIAMILMGLLTFTLAGCGGGNSEAPQEESQEPAQQEEQQEPAQQEESQAPAQEQADPAQNQNSGQEDIISEKKAIEIALEDAGFSESDVQHLHAHLDYDDGRQEYEVHFIHGERQYEYTINAVNGDILEFDSESIYDD